MTVEEMRNRRTLLMNAAIELNHNPGLAGAYYLAEHWIKREIARYDRKLAARELTDWSTKPYTMKCAIAAECLYTFWEGAKDERSADLYF